MLIACSAEGSIAGSMDLYKSFALRSGQGKRIPAEKYVNGDETSWIHAHFGVSVGLSGKEPRREGIVGSTIFSYCHYNMEFPPSDTTL